LTHDVDTYSKGVFCFYFQQFSCKQHLLASIQNNYDILCYLSTDQNDCAYIESNQFDQFEHAIASEVSLPPPPPQSPPTTPEPAEKANPAERGQFYH
jgi:hypothetical protein